MDGLSISTRVTRKCTYVGNFESHTHALWLFHIWLQYREQQIQQILKCSIRNVLKSSSRTVINMHPANYFLDFFSRVGYLQVFFWLEVEEIIP